MEPTTPQVELTDSIEITNDNSKSEPRVSVKIRSTKECSAEDAAALAVDLYKKTLAALVSAA